MLTVIRQQRHLATRVIISTQEPTVVPTKFLDLCSFVIVHRFTSPKWLRLLADHVSLTGSTMDELCTKVNIFYGVPNDCLFIVLCQVISLRTGQAIILSPSGLTVRAVTQLSTPEPDDDDDDDTVKSGPLAPFGQGYLLVHSRLRVTRDGGHSLLAVRDSSKTTRLNRVMGVSAPPSGERSFESMPSAAASYTAPISVPRPVPAPASAFPAFGANARASAFPFGVNTAFSGPSVPPQQSATTRHVPAEFSSLVLHMVEMQAFGPKWIGRKIVRDHLVLNAPQYNHKKGRIALIIAQAVKLGILRKTENNQQIQLCPGYY